MRGGISKKGSKYYPYVSVNGKKKWIKGGGSNTKKEAEGKWPMNF